MKPAKAIARFFLLLGFSYALLMLPWPGLQPTYARLFCGGYQLLLGSFGRDGAVQFVPTKKPGSTHDTRLIFLNRRTGMRVGTALSSSDMGYAPAAFLTALLIATPLPLRRRAGAFAWGMLLLHGAVALTLSLYITFVFSSNADVAIYSLSGFWQSILAESKLLVLFAPFFTLVVPTFIWILVTFRREDLAAIIRPQPE